MMKFYVTCGGARRDAYLGTGHDAGFGNGGTAASRRTLAAPLIDLLGRLGTVVPLDTPSQGIAKAARTPGSVHLCLALPHELPEAAGTETYPVFGLALSSCPDQPFAGRPGSDWRTRLARCGGVVCFSVHAAAAVRSLMGDGIPVLVVPPLPYPASLPRAPLPPPERTVLQVDGGVLDTRDWAETGPPALSLAAPEDEDAPWPDQASLQPVSVWKKTARYRLGITRLHAAHVYREALRDLLPAPVAQAVSRGGQFGTRAARRLLMRRQRPATPAGLAGQLPGQVEDQEAEADFVPWQTGRCTVSLDGLVFAAVHGPWDRSWGDALSAFVAVFRTDAAATLVLTTSGLDPAARFGFASTLRRLGPFDCRIVLLDGEIEGGLDRLIAATRFYLCASAGEAAPLPIMRFMAAGRPAVSPAHSALADFVTPDTALVVAAGIEYEAFPGDVEERLSGTGWRLDWESLCEGLAAARRLTPAEYAARSQAAADALLSFCGPERVLATLAAHWPGQPAWRAGTKEAA